MFTIFICFVLGWVVGSGVTGLMFKTQTLYRSYEPIAAMIVVALAFMFGLLGYGMSLQIGKWIATYTDETFKVKRILKLPSNFNTDYQFLVDDPKGQETTLTFSTTVVEAIIASKETSQVVIKRISFKSWSYWLIAVKPSEMYTYYPLQLKSDL